MKIERPNEIICPVLGGLEALGRSNLEKIGDIIGEAKARQIMDGKLSVRDLPQAEKNRLRAAKLIDEEDRIPGLVADSKGFVSYDQIETSFKKDLHTTGLFAFVGMSAAPAGDHALIYAALQAPEILLRRLTGGLDGMRLNLWALPEGGAKHNYDSLILTENGKYSEARLQEMMPFAETRNGKKVMTRAAFEKAIAARYGRDADRPGSALEGISLALGEAHALSSLRPEGWTEDELRGLYEDKQFPPDMRDRKPVTVAGLMTQLLPGIAKELGPMIAADARRLANAVTSALTGTSTWTGRAMRGAGLSTGQSGLTDTRTNAANGLATAELSQRKGVCPYLAGQTQGMPGPEQLAGDHLRGMTERRD
jgi:hypothetical protein